ncbi:MAG: hypothetical protein M0C28_16080 [Candidatus Moduliflexus flocculans]|nr:hypothetical protein [Candidatus Moduliflexus flocculans]
MRARHRRAHSAGECGRSRPARRRVPTRRAPARLARPEGERHSRAGVRVDDARRVAGQQDVAPRGAARARGGPAR